MIDYLMIIYNNYDLLDLQLKNFQKRFNKEDYNLIVVDNTPNEHKRQIVANGIDKLILLDSAVTFDGISHGFALDTGLKFVESEIVCILDSDFFFLSNDINNYILKKFNEGYGAIGTEWNDGGDTKKFVSKNPHLYKNIPCCFGAFYKKEVATADSWIVTLPEVYANSETGFVEVGYKIRKNILDNNIKTMSWEGSSNGYGNVLYKNEIGEDIGFHYVAGSHRRWGAHSYNEIANLIGVQ